MLPARHAIVRHLAGFLATTISAMLTGWCFAPAGVPVLAWVALAPLLVSLRRASGLGTACLHAWWWTIILGWTVNDWFPRAVSGYYQQPVAVGLGLFLCVCSFTVAPAVALFAGCYRRLARTPGPGLPALAAAAWVLGELVRTELLGDP